MEELDIFKVFSDSVEERCEVKEEIKHRQKEVGKMLGNFGKYGSRNRYLRV